jgi:hypothetical protein
MEAIQVQWQHLPLMMQIEIVPVHKEISYRSLSNFIVTPPLSRGRDWGFPDFVPYREHNRVIFITSNF